MAYEVLPLPGKPYRLDGLSDRLPVSPYENNHRGAVRCPNAIEDRPAGVDIAAAPVFDRNGIGHERLIATNPMVLHKADFDALGGSREPGGARAVAPERTFGSVDRWQVEFTALGKALAGGSGWVSLTWSERLARLTNQGAADHGHTLADGAAVLALGMSGHAHGIDFGAKAGASIDAFMRDIHGERIETRHGRALVSAMPRPAGPNPDIPKVTAAEPRAMVDRGNEVTLVDACLAADPPWRTDMLSGARVLAPDATADLADNLPRDRPVIAYCEYGFQVSAEATAELRRRGLNTRALAGGIAAWHAMAGPTVPLPAEHKQGEV